MVTRPVAGLDRADCRILKRLNEGRETFRPALGNRIEKLLESGLVEERGFGEVAITVRGQLELARWRFRNIPKPRYVVMPGRDQKERYFSKIFKAT